MHALEKAHHSYSIPRYTVALVRETRAESPSYPQLNTAKEVHHHLADLFTSLDREHFKVACLDTKHRLIGVHTVAIGSLSVAIVHPREVFKVAVLLSAAALVLIHNHPSGDPSPSPEDFELTHRLVSAGETLGITIIDHLIIGHEKFYSFAENGKLNIQ
jgi:DNA repair protein RadC